MSIELMMAIATFRRLQSLHKFGELEQKRTKKAITQLLYNECPHWLRWRKVRSWIFKCIIMDILINSWLNLIEDKLSFDKFLRVKPDLFRKPVDILNARLQKRTQIIPKAITSPFSHRRTVQRSYFGFRDFDFLAVM